MTNHEDILSYIREHGPTVPNALKQALKLQDNFVAGALLSELVESGQLSLTNLAHGTSKFYYDVEHPETLEQVSQYLGEKDLRAFQTLKKELVIRASDLTPLLRVAMANIKDYSKELPLNTPDGDQVYWRYYLVPEEEAIELVKQKYFGIKPEQPKEEQKPQKDEKAQEPAKEEQKAELKQKKEPKQEKLPKTSEQTEKETLAKQLQDYFSAKNITVTHPMFSKKTEYAALVTVPNSVGSTEYYCRAKSKKTTSDGDLATAVLEAQQHKLPLLFIGGKLTKKAQELKTQVKGAVIVQWE